MKDKLFWQTKDKKEVEIFSPLQIDMGLNKGLIALTDEEVEVFLNPPKTAEEIEEIRVTTINQKASDIILSKYPLEKQSSAQLGIYGDKYLADMKAFIKQVIDISNEAIDNKTPADEVDWEGLYK